LASNSEMDQSNLNILCRLALKEGEIRSALTESVIRKLPRLKSGTPEEIDIILKKTKNLKKEQKWLYALGSIVDSSELGIKEERIELFARSITEQVDNVCFWGGGDDTLDYLKGETLSLALEWLIPEMLLRALSLNKSATNILLERIPTSDQMYFLTRSFALLLRNPAKYRNAGALVENFKCIIPYKQECVSQWRENFIEWCCGSQREVEENITKNNILRDIYTANIFIQELIVARLKIPKAVTNLWVELWNNECPEDRDFMLERLKLVKSFWEIKQIRKKWQARLLGKSVIKSEYKEPNATRVCEKNIKRLERVTRPPIHLSKSSNSILKVLIKPDWGKVGRASAFSDEERRYEKSLGQFSFEMVRRNLISAKVIKIILNKINDQSMIWVLSEALKQAESKLDKKSKQTIADILKDPTLTKIEQDELIQMSMRDFSCSRYDSASIQLSVINQTLESFSAPLTKWSAAAAVLDIITGLTRKNGKVPIELIEVLKKSYVGKLADLTGISI